MFRIAHMATWPPLASPCACTYWIRMQFTVSCCHAHHCTVPGTVPGYYRTIHITVQYTVYTVGSDARCAMASSVPGTVLQYSLQYCTVPVQSYGLTVRSTTVPGYCTTCERPPSSGTSNLNSNVEGFRFEDLCTVYSMFNSASAQWRMHAATLL